MRTRLWILASCAVALTMQLPLGAQTPRILESRYTGSPLWVPAEAMVDDEKIINLDLIKSIAFLDQIERQRKALDHSAQEKHSSGERPRVAMIPHSECNGDVLTSDHRGGDHPSGTLTDLSTYSKSIVAGFIRSVEPGFSYDEPASLLEVGVSEIIKGSAPTFLFIDYPVARFKIGPFSFCNGNKGFEPRPGDRILLFLYTDPQDLDGVLYTPRLDQIFFQRQEESPFLPPHVKMSPELNSVRSLDEVIKRLRSATLSDSQGGRG